MAVVVGAAWAGWREATLWVVAIAGLVVSMVSLWRTGGPPWTVRRNGHSTFVITNQARWARKNVEIKLEAITAARDPLTRVAVGAHGSITFIGTVYELGGEPRVIVSWDGIGGRRTWSDAVPFDG